MKAVWVVDDLPAVADATVLLLTTEGIEAKPYTCTADVLRDLRAEQPAAMLLDLGMPGGGGNAVLQAIADEPSWTFPVLLYTGMEREIDKRLRGRVSRVLHKGDDPLDLVKHLRRAMGSA